MSTAIGIGIGIPFIRPTSGGAPFVGILDTYPNAELAYSLRLLKTSYSGYAIRVRRSNDNAEQDIGFASNVLDTASLLSFCGSNSGYIVTIYDQSGNAQDVTQANAASQPIIVSTGVVVLVLDNLKPAIQFSGGQLLSKSFTAKSQPQSIFAVSKNTSSPFGGTFGNDFQQGNRPGVGYYFIVPSIGGVTLDSDNANLIITSFILDGASSKTRINAGTQLTGNAGAQTQSSIAFGLGSFLGFMTGFFQEYIQWGSNQNSNEGNIRTLMNDYYEVY